MTKLRLGLAQIKTKLGDVCANRDHHLEYIQQAVDQGVQLLVFPELSLTGYAVQDLAPTLAHKPVPADPIFGPLLEASRQLDLMGRARCDANWTIASSRLKSLAASFGAHGLVGLADEALDGAPGDPVVLRKIASSIDDFARD